MTIKARSVFPRLDPRELVREVVTPAQRFASAPNLGLKFRGLLGMVIQDIRVRKAPGRGDMGGFCVWEATVQFQLPDRDTGKWVGIVQGGDTFPDDEALRAGCNEEQAVAIAALKKLWDHEFREGFIFDNGKEVFDLDDEH